MAQHHREAEYTAPPTGYIDGPTNAGLSPAVLLHGFTQTGRSWAPLLPHLGHRPVVLPDLPGHGAASAVAAGLWATADQLARLAGRAGTWVGYSMGGRVALHVALAHPEMVERLVLVSATPGIRDEAERAERRRSDDQLARRLESEGVAPFLAWWLAQPLFATLREGRAGREERLANTAGGLASSLRLAGTGNQEPLWDRLAELGRRGLPVLCVAGELDTKYSVIAHEMTTAIGASAGTFVVPGAGHACHLEKPEVVGPVVARFASEGDAGGQ